MVTNALAGIQPVYLVIAVTVVFLLLLSMLLHAKKTRLRGHAQPAGPDTNVLSGVLLSSRPDHDVHGAARSTVWSLVVHALLIGGLVAATAMGPDAEADDTTVVHLPPEPAAPPPPPPLPPPTPEPPTPDPVNADPIAPLGPVTISVPDSVPNQIPPPQWGVRFDERHFEVPGPVGARPGGTPGARPTSDLAAGVIFTPRTVEPELKNTDEVQRVLMRTYPPLLRDAGIGGTVLMWFLIDENGKVVKTQLKESSGHPAMDEAAVRVAAVMDFVPAKNRDHNVPVWVAIPIVFTAR